jgi:hypothetical protein
MRLAGDEILITIGEARITLRPTLRAAMRLERRYGGFDKLIAGVLDGDTRVMGDIIAEHTDHKLLDLVFASPGTSMRSGLEVLSGPLLAHCFQLAGVDLEGQEPNREHGEAAGQISFAEYHTKLFEIATGWLGWTPSDAWNATPCEIVSAYKGRIALLQAVFGTSDGKPAGDEPQDLDQKIMKTFTGRGTRVVQRTPKREG